MLYKASKANYKRGELGEREGRGKKYRKKDMYKMSTPPKKKYIYIFVIIKIKNINMG